MKVLSQGQHDHDHHDHHYPLRVLLMRVAIVVVVALVLSPADVNGTSVDPSTWMATYPGVSSRSLLELTLPGTHDSGSYNLTDALVSRDELWPELVEIADKLGVEISDVINWWSKSQTMDFYGQAMGGMRYFDVRAVYYEGEWRTHHGPVVGVLMSVVLNDLGRFMNESLGEVVVVEISDLIGNTTHENDQELGQMVVDTFGPLLYPHNHPLNISIADMVKKNQRMIVAISSNNAVEHQRGLWNDSVILNTYANSCELAAMEAFNEAEVTAFEGTKHSPTFDNYLYKISWTLTPDAACIIDSILPGKPHTLLELADVANADLSSWYDRMFTNVSFSFPALGNLFIIDHFDTSPILDIVLAHMNLTTSDDACC
eukprot:TRINITY_DN1018_c5_g1_i1.p1 TRINITY_DN1018_c5_g1~~TRINITY_DN1018_c5_g1_i1.p1  ORF type:complete len:372 (+),score=48.41 TRINITY_DN1018_c5_g1_i1:183-1298(+)